MDTPVVPPELQATLSVCAEASDARSILDLLDDQSAHQELYHLHPLACGGASLGVRAGTTDLVTFTDTFVHQYHLPPVQLQSAESVIDMGANVGYVSRHLAALFPGTQVYSIEMDAGNCDLLRENVEDEAGRIRVLHAAVWTRDGEVSYDGSKNADAFSVDESLGIVRPIAVRAVSPATVMEMSGFGSIDYLKMDIEGAEIAIFAEGDGKWLAPVRSVNVEVHDPEAVGAVRRSLDAAGFRTVPSPSHWSAVLAWRDY